MTGQTPALECTEIRFSVGSLSILNGVQFSVAPGEICGIVGPNGSGKSTLLNVISGFVKAQDGTVRLEGADMTDVQPWRRARAGLGRTFQLVRLVEELSAIENAASGLLMRMRKRAVGDGASAEVRGCLERVRVDEFAEWSVRTLSFGSRRKVELARAIAARPKVLLVDELTSGVSQAHIQEFEVVLREEAERGCAVVIVDHNLDFIRSITPRVVVLDAGVAVFEGAPEEAFTDPHVIEAYLGKETHD